jgi:hypothetical protein
MSRVITLRRARLSRTPLVLATGLSTALVLAGCGSTEEGSASPASSDSSSAASTSESEESAAPVDLTAGLLPADAFGADATVAPLSEEELAAGAALAADTEGLTITPESCAAAVQDSQPGLEDFDDFAAQSAQSASSIVVQLLTSGGSVEDPVGDLASAAETCPEATITSPEIGTATVSFTAVDVPDLGDGSAAVSYTTTVTGPDGTAISIPALVGIVADGDRLLTLTSTSLGGTVDEASFGPLLQQAYEYQADALD